MDYDATISQLNDKIKLLKEQAESATHSFLAVCGPFICTWSQDTIERIVTSKPEIAKQLGVEGLRKLKEDLEIFYSDVSNLIQKHINRDELWLHRGEYSIGPGYSGVPYQFYGNRAPESLDKGVREVLGYIGSIVAKHGFSEGVREDYRSEPGSSTQRYRYALDWSGDMKTSLIAYSDIFKQYDESIKTLKSTERQKEQSEAKDLWDKA